MIALPEKFSALLREALPEAEALCLEAALDTDPAVSVRFNPYKLSERPDGEQVPWNRYGFYLPERPRFTLDPSFHAGAYYVQEASSMFVEHLVREAFGETEGLSILDVCAAPGGKTTLYSTLAGLEGLVVANEVIRSRAAVLADNVRKWGLGNVAVTNNDPSHLSGWKEMFDVVAVDAPCSGEGMFRKDDAARSEWSEDNVRLCAARQRRIVADVWSCLKPGGILIYSTCTFNRTENELMVSHIADTFGAKSIELGLDRFAGVFGGIDTPHHCYRFAPGHVRGEGLFVSALRKPGNGTHREVRGSSARQKPKPEAKAFAEHHISRPEVYTIQVSDDSIRLVPTAHAAFLQEASTKVRFLNCGLCAATLKGREYAPTHALALSTALAPGSFGNIATDYHGAMSYLRGESLSEVPPEVSKGYVLACYGGRPLGFVKNIGRRANNLYPDALRLRLDARTLPAEAPTPLIANL